jgi:RNA exonuclease 1
VLSLPPLPTSSTENSNVPIEVPAPTNPLPSKRSQPVELPSSIDPRSEEAAAFYGGIPFITRTFSHTLPTRAPGDAIRMHSVLNTFFQGPVSGEEKKRRLLERIAGPSLLHNPFLSLRLITPTTAERAGRKDPSKYLLTVEQMVENDYPVPSYLADVFKAPDGWIETPEPTDTKSEPESVYAIDCEMVRAFTMLTQY